MTQEIYNIIVKVLERGAPALSNDLITALNDVLHQNANLKRELLNNQKPVKEQVEGEN